MTDAKILVLDIETSPILADVWGLWKNNVGLNQIRRDWFMLSWAAKWLDDPHVYSDALHHYDGHYKQHPEDDEYILRSLWDMLDEADIVVGHNSDKFDLPKIRARMVTHGMPPFSPVRETDTLKMAKKSFRFSSNKLAFIADALGVGQKLDTGGHLLWVGCIRGDKKSWATMEEYNRQDVVVTEEVYLRLRPWSKGLPNMGLYVDSLHPVCPCCGSPNIRKNGTKTSKTNMSTFQEYHCKDCGAYRRGRKNLAKRTHLLANIG